MCDSSVAEWSEGQRLTPTIAGRLRPLRASKSSQRRGVGRARRAIRDPQRSAARRIPAQQLRQAGADAAEQSGPLDHPAADDRLMTPPNWHTFWNVSVLFRDMALPHPVAMATLKKKIDAERRMRELLESGGLPEPDLIEYDDDCIRLFFEETKTVVVIDLDDEADSEPELRRRVGKAP